MKTTFCECEASHCHVHYVGTGLECSERAELREYHVAGFKQTLCKDCAEHARAYCEENHYEFKQVAR